VVADATGRPGGHNRVEQQVRGGRTGPQFLSGIFWTLGRYDRPWPPERPIFGTVRYMSLENTARKMPTKEYLRRYAPDRHPEPTVPDR
jgi:hypothetical protein